MSTVLLRQVKNFGRHSLPKSSQPQPSQHCPSQSVTISSVPQPAADVTYSYLPLDPKTRVQQNLYNLSVPQLPPKILPNPQTQTIPSPPKLQIDPQFWCGYTSLQAMERLLPTNEKKEDIATVMSNFALVHKKPLNLFNRVRASILNSVLGWSATELGIICNSWAKLGYLREDFMMGISPAVCKTVKEGSTDSLVYLMDSYASVKLAVESVLDSLNAEIYLRSHQMTGSQISLYMSGLARLNSTSENSMKVIESLESRIPFCLDDLSSKDVALIVYSIGKLFSSYRPAANIPKILNEKTDALVKDFTAKELEMIVTGFNRMGYSINPDTLTSISQQTQRRLAQFNASTLISLLRGFHSYNFFDQLLSTRIICQLPRLAESMNFKEIIEMAELLFPAQADQIFLDLVHQKIENSDPKQQQQSPASLSLKDWLRLGQVVNVSDSVHFQERLASSIRKFPVGQILESLKEVSAFKYDVTINPSLKSAILERKADIMAHSAPSECADLYCVLAKFQAYHDSALADFMADLMIVAVNLQET
jgi:hypothetical protein